MFVGHLAVALAAKRVSPRTPLAALIGASFGLDLIWPLFLLAGIERVRIAPGITAFTPLDFEHYPWSHSLSMAIIWGVVAGRLLVVRSRHLGTATLIALVVISHWILDFVTHRPDLPLWPGGQLFGLGLWNSIPATFVVEGALFAGAIVAYWTGTRETTRSGLWALLSLIAFTTIIWATGPFSPPPPSAQAIAFVGLAMWLFPLWGAWIDRTRETTR